MTLGTVQGVADLCHNTDTDLINRMLVKGRARITSILLKQGVTAPSSDVDLDTAVEAITSRLIALGPGNVNPRTGFTVDGFSRKDGNESQLDEWQTLADESVADYITNNINARSLPVMKVVARDGVMLGAYTETD